MISPSYTCNNDGHGFQKGGGKVGGGRIEHYSSARTLGRGREDDQDYQVTRKINNQHITLLLPTIPDNNQPDLLCDNEVECTSGWKCNLNKVISKVKTYGTPYRIQ